MKIVGVQQNNNSNVYMNILEYCKIVYNCFYFSFHLPPWLPLWIIQYTSELIRTNYVVTTAGYQVMRLVFLVVFGPKLLSVQCNAWHWTDIKIMRVCVFVSVYLSVCALLMSPFVYNSHHSFCPILLKCVM